MRGSRPRGCHCWCGCCPRSLRHLCKVLLNKSRLQQLCLKALIKTHLSILPFSVAASNIGLAGSSPVTLATLNSPRMIKMKMLMMMINNSAVGRSGRGSCPLELRRRPGAPPGPPRAAHWKIPVGRSCPLELRRPPGALEMMMMMEMMMRMLMMMMLMKMLLMMMMILEMILMMLVRILIHDDVGDG